MNVESAILTNTVLHSVLLSAGSAALGGVLYLLGQGAQYVAGRIKNQRLRDAWTLAADYAQRVVREVASSYVQPTKAAGQWSDATAAQAKTMATTQLKNMLTAQADAKMITLPATTAQHNLDTMAATFVESALHDLKVEGATVAAATATAAAAVALPAAAPVVNLIQTGMGALASADGENVSRETSHPDIQQAAAAAAPAHPTPAPVAP